MNKKKRKNKKRRLTANYHLPLCPGVFIAITNTSSLLVTLLAVELLSSRLIVLLPLQKAFGFFATITTSPSRFDEINILDYPASSPQDCCDVM